ncbi:GNAT family N-acetyltransferase [uncultured Pelagimonas sp.]|uniref:GNAT family N-acetyltransferase n=1 Tax=uncultured Pelagimonas sp. TaxID=1618102 RepID=UPI002627E0A3|nr:GNAT family N-acetyltransferase [uncultured Pelagimonas sp.]
MINLIKGRYSARQATTDTDIDRVQRLRGLAFDRSGGIDSDRFDALCDHVLIEDRTTNALVCCFRFLQFPDGREIGQSYSSQFYELAQLHEFEGRIVEMGRFCVHPDFSGDPDILRVAWGAMTVYVDANKVELLFGCVSFAGTNPVVYQDAFAALQERHLAPRKWAPMVKATNVIPFEKDVTIKRDAKQANLQMPPMLRTYLLMGGWVSDHAVVDHEMNTLHVFTGVEIATIPNARKRLLRAVAGSR